MRIISLVPSVTETLFELGLGDQIVAITRWCNRPADQVAQKPKIGGTKNPRLSLLAEYKPDIVILDCDENRKEDAEALERRGIRTFTVFPKTIEDSIQLIRDFGELFSVQERANAIVQEVLQRMRSLSPARAYKSLILIWRTPYMSFNADTYAHSACALFGFENVFANHAERYPKLSGTEIRSKNPEIVLFPDEPYPFRKKHMEQFKSEFPDLQAVVKNELLLFDGSYVAWHGYGTLRALREFPSVVSAQLS
jgi:ABC-type Fe3+-hydroxamate transport system substrate-binding protein